MRRIHRSKPLTNPIPQRDNSAFLANGIAACGTPYALCANPSHPHSPSWVDCKRCKAIPEEDSHEPEDGHRRAR